jgi:peptidoglycan/LPS O-acetylase OafA/YrhL
MLEGISTLRHISSLDGLRGAAALMVVFFHYFPRHSVGPLEQLASFGWTGVDIFFVLSGFLITGILYEQRGSYRYFGNFYIRRLLRLSPVYTFLSGVALISAFLTHTPIRPLQIAMIFYGANFVLPIDNSLAMIGPFEMFHVWSLSLEEQFYLIWPWLVGGRLSKETLKKICIAGIVLAPMLRIFMVHKHVHTLWLYQSLPTRMDALLMGALLALIPLPSLRTARLVAASALMVFAVTVWSGNSAFFESRPIQGLGYSALAFFSAALLTMSLHPGTVFARIFSSKLLRFYGKHSYGLYLWHYFLLRQFNQMQAWVALHLPAKAVAGVLGYLVILLISTGAAVLSYQWIEQPFLKLKDRFSSKERRMPVVIPSGVRRKKVRGGESVETELETAPSLH